MTMKKRLIPVMVAAVIAIAAPSESKALGIPYPNVGTAAPVSTFTATSSGDIWAYFYGSDAAYASTIGLRVNNISTGVFGLPNHFSSYGDALNLGYANLGDVLEFELVVPALGHSWYSNPVNNVDTLNHAYAAPFAGDSFIPAGIYVGFEDLAGGGDLDYNDHQFVFVGVSQRVPDAGVTSALLGVALAGLGLIKRKLA